MANAPVYSWVDSAMGRGVLGGSLRVQTLQAEEVAALALEVLRGADAGRHSRQNARSSTPRRWTGAS